MSIRSWPIRTLFPLMAGSILVSALVTAGGATVAASQVNDARAAVKARNQAQADLAKIEFLRERIQFNNVAQSLAPTRSSRAQASVKADLAEITQVSTHAQSIPLSATEHTAFVAVDESIDRFSSWLGTLQATKPADIAAQSTGYAQANGATTKAAQKLLAAELTRQEDRLSKAMRFFRMLMIALCMLTGILISSAILLIGRGINRRLAALRAGLQAIAGGDLTVKVPAGGQYELADIAVNVNTVVEQFSKVFLLLGATSSRLGGAATHLETLAAEVGRSAGETSAQAEVVARTADEVSQNVQAATRWGRPSARSRGTPTRPRGSRPARSRPSNRPRGRCPNWATPRERSATSSD
jgi:methyl-accepting chemotaxis protein